MKLFNIVYIIIKQFFFKLNERFHGIGINMVYYDMHSRIPSYRIESSLSNKPDKPI